MLSVILLALVLVFCLLLVALGLPGTWMMIGAALLFGPVTGRPGVGVVTLIAIFAMALIGELIEFKLALRYTSRYGGSRRAGWGAIAGGIMGALIGLPIPVVGSVVGAFAGAFGGALLAELTTGAQTGDATRAAKGAFLGRVAGTATKIGIGVVMATWILLGL